jgi:predicted ATPase
VGRHRELAVLHDAKRELAKRTAAVVLLAGEAGIGKSRLLAQFLRDIASERMRNVASVDCLEYASAPLGSIRALLVTLARVVPHPLPPLLTQFVKRDAASETVEPAELFVAVAAFLRACADKRATIVTIEDVHWADAMTLDFLSYAATSLAATRLLIVATYRSSELNGSAPLRAAVSRLMREPITFRIELEGLARADLRALILRALDGHEALPVPAIESVASRAEGIAQGFARPARRA